MEKTIELEIPLLLPNVKDEQDDASTVSKSLCRIKGASCAPISSARKRPWICACITIPTC